MTHACKQKQYPYTMIKQSEMHESSARGTHMYCILHGNCLHGDVCRTVVVVGDGHQFADEKANHLLIREVFDKMT
jgi:hypothetical protein